MQLVPEQIAWLWALVALAFAVEAAAGFGATIVALSFGALLFSIDALLAVLVPVNLLVSVALAWAGRRVVAWDSLRSLLPRVLLGMLLGLGLAGRVGQEGLRLGFAGFVVVLSAAQLWRLRRGEAVRPLRPGWRTFTLLCAGGIHGLFATGGPLVVYALGREILDKSAFRATLSTLWILTSLVLCVDLVARGTLDAQALGLSAAALPAVVLGVGAGGLLHRRVSQEAFRQGVYTLLLAVGLTILARAALSR